MNRARHSGRRTMRGTGILLGALALASLAAAPAAAQDVSVDLGTLPAGKKVRVFFDVTIDSPVSGPQVMSVANQGTVSSSTSAFVPVPTDDPDDGTSAADPTRTTLDGLTVGNLVWREDNGNNVFDGSPTDTPLDGVTMNLYLDDGDGVLDAGDGAPIATTVTAGGGLYSFAGLQPGDYVVEVAACNFTGVGCTATLAGLGSIPPVPAADPDDDVDNDDNGDVVMGFGVAAEAVTLAFNDEPPAAPAMLPDGDADTDTNLTVDFGFAPVADLEIVSKSDLQDPVVAGFNINYDIEFRNNGPGAASTVTVTDATPPGTTFVQTLILVGSGWMVSEPAGGGTGTVTFSKASVASGETAKFRLVVEVDPDVLEGSTIMNTATAAAATFDPDTSNNAKTASTSIVAEADVEITAKSDAPDPVVAGENLTYTVTFANNGPSDAQTVVVSDTLPAGTTFVSAGVTAGTGWTPTTPAVGSGGTVQFAKATVGAFETATFEIVVEVGADVADGSTIANTATASSATTDPTPGNNSAMASTTVATEVDLSVTKTDGVVSAVPGQDTLTYTIVASNPGPSDVIGATVADTIPVELVSLDLVSITPVGGATSSLAPGPFAGSLNDTVNLPKGSSLTYTVTGQVASSATGTLSNTVTLTVPAGVTERNAANNSATDDDTVMAPEVDLEVTKTESIDPVAPGLPGPGNLTYVVTVENLGPSDAASVSLSEAVTLQPGVTIDSITPAAGTSYAPPNGANGTWTVGSLAAGASETLTIVLTVGASAALGMDVIGDTASLSTVTPADSNGANDSATELTSIAGKLIFTKVFDPDSVGEGFETTLTFTIDNMTSPLAATNLAFSDPLPFPLLVSDSPSVVSDCGGTVTAPAGMTTIDLVGGTVATGAACTISVAINVPSVNFAGDVVNTTSELTWDTGSSDPATDTLTVLACTTPDGSNLTIDNDVVLVPRTHTVCNTISVKQHYLVLGPNGVLTLQAGVAVIFFNGVEIGKDGQLVVEIDPSLVP